MMLKQDACQIAWVTDPHFNFVRHSDWQSFVDKLVGSAADLILLGGDISEADDFAWNVERLALATSIPVAFVLGNHDFYRGSIAETQTQARQISDRKRVVYLTGDAPVRLSDAWTLVGDDCPADGRCGDAESSPVQMNDFHLIQEFRGLGRVERNSVMQELGKQAADRLHAQLRQAATLSPNILVLTHVPPLRDACWHEGRVSDDDWAPYFVCQAAGDVLTAFCASNKQRRVVVLCGHTHSAGIAHVAPNLTIRTGAAVYGEPQITELLDLDEI